MPINKFNYLLVQYQGNVNNRLLTYMNRLCHSAAIVLPVLCCICFGFTRQYNIKFVIIHSSTFLSHILSAVHNAGRMLPWSNLAARQ